MINSFKGNDEESENYEQIQVANQHDEILKRIKARKPVFQISSCFRRPLSLIYNRKDKSLEELSRRFLKCLVNYESRMVYLDKLTVELGVERRRLYDIINILESLKVVSRRCKNKYSWNGFKTIFLRIKELKDIKLSEFMEIEQLNPRKEKSLEVLSVGFLKLFLQKQQIWSLEEAAKQLSPNETEQSKLKTKIRRLYDIANVLKSIGLIRKIHIDRKSNFQWVGEEGLDQFVSSLDDQNKNKSVEDSIQVYEAPMSPFKPQIKVINQIISEPRQINIEQMLDIIVDVMIHQNQQQQQSTAKKQIQDREQHYNKNLQLTPKLRQTLTIIHPPQNKSPSKYNMIEKLAKNNYK